MEGGAQGEHAIMEAGEAQREGVKEAISVGVSVERIQPRHLRLGPGAQGRAPIDERPPIDEPAALERGLHGAVKILKSQSLIYSVQQATVHRNFQNFCLQGAVQHRILERIALLGVRRQAKGALAVVALEDRGLVPLPPEGLLARRYQALHQHVACAGKAPPARRECV